MIPVSCLAFNMADPFAVLITSRYRSSVTWPTPAKVLKGRAVALCNFGKKPEGEIASYSRQD